MLTTFSSNSNIINNMHFFHGNSMTPESYENLLNQFSDNFNIKCSVLRPLSKNNKYVNFNNWDIFLNDYVSSIKNEKILLVLGIRLVVIFCLKLQFFIRKNSKKSFYLTLHFLRQLPFIFGG